jgi:O-antigen/teichoic acid export membrane protein
MSLKQNVVANFVGQGWTALMAIAFIPLYIKYLGVEAYGLIGFYAVMQAWMTILDMGMTPTINREMALYKVGVVSIQTILDLLRSIEWICAGIALLIISIIWFATPMLVNSWLKVESLPIEAVSQAIIVMGFVAAARLWEEVYRAAIRGMQQQVWLNGMQAILATLRWAGVLVVLVWVSPTVQAFFIWQGIISVASVIIYAHKTYQWLPDFKKTGQFSLKAIKDVQRFAGGMVVITLLSLLLTQIDKLLLSGLLSLEEFGWYAIAAVVAGGLAQLITPINAAIYPKFTELVSQQDKDELIKTYHNACQLMSAIIIPPALILAAFSEPVLFLWTGDKLLTNSVAPILSLLVLGTLFNGFMNVPYMLQLAYGWTGYAIRVNLIAVLIIIPAILWAVPKYGAIGAAWIWILLNVAYVLVGVHFMYIRLLPEQKWRWYRDSILNPMGVGVTFAFGLAYLMPPSHGSLEAGLSMLVVTVFVSVSVAIVIPSIRQRIIFWRH